MEATKLPSEIIDPYLVKVWWQSSINSINIGGTKWFERPEEELDPDYPHPDSLVQELLLKDENLIKVTIPYDSIKKNELRLRNRTSGEEEYINLSKSTDRMPGKNCGIGYDIIDSDTLLPFTIEAGVNKQLWFTVHVPDETKPGIYKGSITITSLNKIIKVIPLEIEVLPFSLQEPEMLFGMFYDGVLGEINGDYGYRSGYRNLKQYKAELKDLLDHGISYPSNLNNRYSQDNAMKTREEIGLPVDKIFISGILLSMERYFNFLKNISGYEQYNGEFIKNEIIGYKNTLNNLGYADSLIYIMGKDEARGNDLIQLKKLYSWMIDTLGVRTWQAVAPNGLKAHKYMDTFSLIGDYLSVPVLYGFNNTAFSSEITLKAISDWSKISKKPLMYGAPQTGLENPEVYRKNYGLRLYLEGWGGSFEYNYMAQKGASVWNDWDISEINWRGPVRDIVFVYPKTNGVINTIQWEGRREGYDDARYFATLLKYLNKSNNIQLKNEVNTFINSLDYGYNASPDMDRVRKAMIDFILLLMKE